MRVCWFAARDQLRGDSLTQWRILENSGVSQTAWFDTQQGEPEASKLDARSSPTPTGSLTASSAPVSPGPLRAHTANWSSP